MMVLNFILILLSSYLWPMRPFNTAHGVSATLGDGRGTATASRFHRGIDIPADYGTNVFSLISGTAKRIPSGNGIIVGDYWYIHLNNLLGNNTSVTGIVDTTTSSPTQIGDVMDYGQPGTLNDHLHFQIGPQGGPFKNPLSYNEGPIGFSDNGNPIVYSVDFWKSGSEGQTETQVQSPLSDTIDIRAKCKDRGTSGGVNTTTGIYKLEWLIKNIDTKISYGPYQTLTFDQVQPPNNGNPVLLVYDRHNYSSSSPFYYWVTNYVNSSHNVEDRYWNTKLKSGQDWNGVDADFNSDAKYPDGEYRVWVLAYDIKGMDMLTNMMKSDIYKINIMNNKLLIKSCKCIVLIVNMRYID